MPVVSFDISYLSANPVAGSFGDRRIKRGGNNKGSGGR
jgi:hypothetical protein